MQRMMLFLSSELLHLTLIGLILILLSSCAKISRPDTDLCVVNAPAGHMKCYNLKRDYDDSGIRKPDAKPNYKPAKRIEDLNKNICTDPDGFAELKAFVDLMRQEYEKCQKR